MAETQKKKVITKKDWSASFALIGEAKINDFTFKIDEKSEKSSYIYNNMNIGIDCGEKFGTVYTSMIGGYFEDRDLPIYAHGKKEDGTDDYEAQIHVAWEDRFDDEILEKIGNNCFITVGLEKTDKGNIFYKKFLSQYDAIAYIKEHLEDGMVLNVRGNLKYSLYNDTVQTQKNITNIVLSKVEDPANYKATFTQTVLLDKDSTSLKKENIDTDKGIVYVTGRVLDYLKEYNGIEVKGQYPFTKQFEYAMDFSREDLCKKIMNGLLKVKKGITQITFEGDFICGGATVMATWDDVPDDIKQLVEWGVYTKEDAIQKCSTNGKREERMVFRRPHIKQVGEDDKRTTVIQKFEERYTEEDLVLDYLNDFHEASDDDELPFPLDDSDEEKTESGESEENLDWLNDLS